MRSGMACNDTVLVTGALGLVGRAVVDKLEARGTSVVGIDRVAVGKNVRECDLMDVHRLHAIVEETGVTGIIHCGAYSGPMVSKDNPWDLISVNVMGTANMLEIARMRKMRRFVHCSSASVYGSTSSGPVREDVPLNPASVYGATKLAAEQLVLAFAREHGVDAAALRLAWIYGPNRTSACVLRQMISDALAGQETKLSWGADFFRQYIHSDDAAEALLAAFDATDLQQRVYNITGGSYLTLGEVAMMVRAALPEAIITLLPGPDPLDDTHHQFDISAAASELGFQPKISLEQGIASMIEIIRPAPRGGRGEERHGYHS